MNTARPPSLFVVELMEWVFTYIYLPFCYLDIMGWEIADLPDTRMGWEFTYGPVGCVV